MRQTEGKESYRRGCKSAVQGVGIKAEGIHHDHVFWANQTKTNIIMAKVPKEKNCKKTYDQELQLVVNLHQL